VLSFYYHPDLCAGSFRTTPLVNALRERAPAGSHLHIITTLPNRYHTFTQDAAELESGDGVEIRRIKLPAHRSDMRGQARAFLYFARQVLRIVADREYDVVFATSSRLMTATLGAWVARRKGVPLYLDIRDLFVDTIKDVFPAPWAAPIGFFFSFVETWTVKSARRINLVSRGFEGYFRRRYRDCSLAWFTNGIDDEFLSDSAPNRVRSDTDRRITILYAGNIGAGQGLHEIVPELARELQDVARFVIIGDGGRRSALETAIANAGITNVELRPPVSRAVLMEAYRSADVLFVHLGPYPAFEKVLPSKLFEYGALGKPVLAGVGGYAAQFVREEIPNAAVFQPCNASEATRALRSLDIADHPRLEFVAKYSRVNIARAMADDVLAMAHATGAISGR